MTAAMRPALLVIDLQRWFLEVGPPEKLAAVESLIARTNELIDFFTAKTCLSSIQTVHRSKHLESVDEGSQQPSAVRGSREAEHRVHVSN